MAAEPLECAEATPASSAASVSAPNHHSWFEPLMWTVAPANFPLTGSWRIIRESISATEEQCNSDAAANGRRAKVNSHQRTSPRASLRRARWRR